MAFGAFFVRSAPALTTVGLCFVSQKADIAVDILLAQQPINLPLVPLYEDERNLLARMDETSEELRNRLLKALQEDNSIFCIDLPGLSLASNLEQAKIDIKDREAFANDMKEMLMSLMDEEDINDD